MCPHGYHHSGFMATPALGTRDVRLYIYASVKFKWGRGAEGDEFHLPVIANQLNVSTMKIVISLQSLDINIMCQ